jgi:hypothetical protein
MYMSADVGERAPETIYRPIYAIDGDDTAAAFFEALSEFQQVMPVAETFTPYTFDENPDSRKGLRHDIVTASELRRALGHAAFEIQTDPEVIAEINQSATNTQSLTSGTLRCHKTGIKTNNETVYAALFIDKTNLDYASSDRLSILQSLTGAATRRGLTSNFYYSRDLGKNGIKVLSTPSSETNSRHFSGLKRILSPKRFPDGIPVLIGPRVLPK